MSPQGKAIAAEIRRYARIVEIKRAALQGAVEALKSNSSPTGELSKNRRPRPIFVVPARHVRMLMSCPCAHPSGGLPR